MKKLLLVLFALIPFVLFSQEDFNTCEDATEAPGALFSQVGGKFKPAQTGQAEYMKALIIYVQFDCDQASSGNWNYDELPDFAYNMIDSELDIYHEKTLSDYYKVMSSANFRIIGDIFPELVHLTDTSIIDYQQANTEVIDYVDQYVDFQDYDSWSLVNGEYVFNEGQGDGYADMIFICYRFANPSLFHLNGGIAWLGPDNFGTNGLYTTNDTRNGSLGYVKLDGHLSATGSGVTFNRFCIFSQESNMVGLAHEYGHYLFGGDHPSEGGLMASAAGGNYGTYAMDSWERERLGYVGFTSPSNYPYTLPLGDFLTEDDVLKIPVPSSSTSYFLVENHQRQNLYDQIIRGGILGGGFNWNTTIGSGIYVYKVSNGDTYPPSKTIVTADGRWDWSFVGTIYNPGLGNGTVPLTSAYAVNRNSGKTDRNPYHIQYGGAWWSKWYDKNPLTKEYELTRDVMGDEYDAFNIGYNELFTPYSNPSTYFGGNTDMWMQLYSQNGTEITVKVYDDVDDGNDLPPSPPQKVWVNRAFSNGNWHAKVYWEANIEPNMQYSGQYQIYRTWTYGTEPTSWAVVATIDAYDGQNNPVTSWIDPDIPYGTNGDRHLFYRLKAIDNSGNKISLFSNYDWILWDGSVFGGGGGDGKAKQDEIYTIENYELAQNYPNPFNPVTYITYSIKDRGSVHLKIYDILGTQVAELVNEVKEPGVYTALFKAVNYPSGVYIYKITVNNFMATKKMLLVK